MPKSKIKIGNVTIDKSKPEQLTQSYYAGMLCASIHYYYPSEEINLLIALVNFHSLKEVIGSRLWVTLSIKQKTRHIISLYNKFAWSFGCDRKIEGGYKEFMLGYSAFYNRIRRNTRKMKRVFPI